MINIEHKGKTVYSEEQVISMLEFLIDNIFVEFEGKHFQQIIGIPIGTNCMPLLADLFLSLYESEYLQALVKTRGYKKSDQLISHSDILLIFFLLRILPLLIGFLLNPSELEIK